METDRNDGIDLERDRGRDGVVGHVDDPHINGVGPLGQGGIVDGRVVGQTGPVAIVEAVLVALYAEPTSSPVLVMLTEVVFDQLPGAGVFMNSVGGVRSTVNVTDEEKQLLALSKTLT